MKKKMILITVKINSIKSKKMPYQKQILAGFDPEWKLLNNHLFFIFMAK
jgi:hypothetical protein